MSTQDDRVTTPAAESIPEVPESAPESAPDIPTGSPDKSVDSPAQPKEATSEKTNASRSATTASKTASKTAPKTAPKSAPKTASKTAPKSASTKSTASKTEPVKRPVTKPVATTRATGAASAVTKPAPVNLRPNDTGFVKPKPKSPTKPVGLPSSLLAPTAASSYKSGASRQSLSRNLPQTSTAQTASAVTAVRPLKRQPSAATRKRHSFSSPSTIKPSPSRQSPYAAPSDLPSQGGFLARMMRQTAASSNKIADRGADKGAPSTPIKKAAPRPSNVAADATKRTAKSPISTRTRETKEVNKAPTKTTKAATPVAKASVPLATVASSADAGPEETQNVKEERQVERTAEVAKPEHAENDVAEAEKEEKAKDVELPKDSAADMEEKHEIPAAQELVSELSVLAIDKPAPVETTSLEEAAVETAQVETAEEAIEIAGQVDGKERCDDDPAALTKESLATESNKEAEVGNEFGSADNVEPMAATDKLMEADEPAAKTAEVTE